MKKDLLKLLLVIILALILFVCCMLFNKIFPNSAWIMELILCLAFMSMLFTDKEQVLDEELANENEMLRDENYKKQAEINWMQMEINRLKERIPHSNSPVRRVEP